jgi:hypothetical protein
MSRDEPPLLRKPGPVKNGSSRRGDPPSSQRDSGVSEARTLVAREAETRRPEVARGSLGVAMAAHRFLASLDSSPGVPVPTALRARVAAAWPLHVPGRGSPRSGRGS